MSTKLDFPWPIEPVLEMDDIQGIAVPGFFKPYQVLLGIQFKKNERAVGLVRKCLREIAPYVATARKTLDDRRSHRDPKLRNKIWPPLVAVGFTYQGLVALTPGASELPSRAFRAGLPSRAALLGDPADDASPGNPANWSVGAAGDELDFLVVVAGDDQASAEKLADKIEQMLTDARFKIKRQLGHIREDQKGHEHFGFDDGVSQPGIRGRATADADDFITERHVDKSQFPAAALYGYPGQDLVWPGEFVIGYPQTSPDPLIPGPNSAAHPSWARNGSYLVYRRLRQDVPLFWKTMQDEANRLSLLPGFADIDAARLAAKLVGRWPSGAPVSRTPKTDNEALGDDQLANNHFRFDCDTATLKLVDGEDRYDNASADPIGLACPLASHIRKVNTRDSPSDMGARSSTYERRILRVGVPFGASAKKPFKASQNDAERGLLFLSIQSSIEEQFEFLQARWMNDDSRPKAPSGNDMIVGQNQPVADGVRRCTLFGSGAQQAKVESAKQFVIPTGGGYFFLPAINHLHALSEEMID